MARYIDADKLLEVLNEELMYESRMHTEEHEEYLKKGLRIAINDVKRFPTDNVVPKSEAAREIFAEIEDVLNNIGYFDEIDFNALKKKYI